MHDSCAQAKKNELANKDAVKYARRIKAMAKKVADLQANIETTTDHAIARNTARVEQINNAIAQARGSENTLLRQKALLVSAEQKQAAVEAQLDAAKSMLDAAQHKEKDAKSEELQEAVPEAVKNMLLVMSASGALAPGAPEGLWENTWKRAAAIDAGLTPSIVGAKG